MLTQSRDVLIAIILVVNHTFNPYDYVLTFCDVHVAQLRCLVICFNIKFYSRSANSSTSNAKKKRTQPQFSDSDDDFTDTPSPQPGNNILCGPQHKNEILYEDTGKLQWFKGKIPHYNPSQRKCTTHFPYDNYDLEFSVDNEDVHYLDQLTSVVQLLYIPILKIVVGLVLNHYHPLIQLVLFTILYPTNHCHIQLTLFIVICGSDNINIDHFINTAI